MSNSMVVELVLLKAGWKAEFVANAWAFAKPST